MAQKAIIAGAGPVGLMLAVELARRGISTRIVEKLTDPHIRSKAIGVTPGTLELLEASGLTDTFLSAGVKMQGANFYSENRHIARLGLEEMNKARYHEVNLPQSATESILAKKLAEFGVNVERGVELVDLAQQDNSVTVTLRTPTGSETVTADWLIGCDGIHSQVRSLCGIEFKGKRFAENWLSGDVLVENGPGEGEAHVFLSKKGFVVFFPLPGRWRISVELREEELGMDGSNFAKLQKVVSERIRADIRISDPSWIDVYNVHTRLASTMLIGRVALAGDAAHSHTPTGGQGMNNGILDAVKLAEAIHQQITSGSEELLKRYTPERRSRARKIIFATSVGSHLVLVKSTLVRLARDWLIRTVIPHVDRRLNRQAAGFSQPATGPVSGH